jgi:hypothetical protein
MRNIDKDGFCVVVNNSKDNKLKISYQNPDFEKFGFFIL